MLAIALDNAEKGEKRRQEELQLELDQMNNDYQQQEALILLNSGKDGADLGETMRGLINNEAGEALYDSSKNIDDKMTDSQISIGR